MKFIALLLGLQGVNKVLLFASVYRTPEIQQGTMNQNTSHQTDSRKINIKFSPLIDPENVLIPLLHIVVGLRKILLK